MPSWFLPVLASAFFLGFYDLSKKRAVVNNNVLPVLFCSTLCGAVFYLLLLPAMGASPFQVWRCCWLHYFLICCKTLLVASSWICAYLALKTLPLSIAAPIRATAPFWTVIGGVILYHERPTGFDLLGMLLILGGYYGFSVMGKKEGLSFRKSKGMQLIIAGTILGAASALFDKFLMNCMRIPPRTVQFHFAINLAVLFGILWLIYILIKRNPEEREPFHWHWTIPCIGILLILADATFFYGISLPESPISQLSLVRRLSGVITFVMTAIIYHEKNIAGKAVALSLILAGVILLGLF